MGKETKLVDAGLTWHPSGLPVFGTPDRLVELNDDKGGMDAKTRRFKKGWGRDGTPHMPLDVEVQMRTYMEVFDVEWWHVAVLFGFDLQIMPLKRDKQLGKDMLGIATDWWQKHIVEDEPPTPDGAKATREVLQRMYTVRADSMIRPPTADELDVYKELITVRQQYKSISERKTELENQLRHAIGQDDGIEGVATWKQAKPKSRFDSKALKAQMPDIYKQFAIEVNGNRTLRIFGD